MIYVYVLISSLSFAYLASRAKDKGLVYISSAISILIPSIVGGLRATGVGRDTVVYGYGDVMKALSSPDMGTFVFSGPEIGYKFLCYVVANTFGHENWCYFAYQLITVTCVYIGAYKHKDKLSMPFIMFVWLVLNYVHTYNGIRQSLACAIIFMNLDQLEQKHYGKFAVTIAVAALFHTSAIVNYALLTGIHIVTTSQILKRNLWLKILVLYGSLVLFTMSVPIITYIVNRFSIFAKYTAYVNSGKEGGIHISSSILYLGETLMVLLYGKGASRRFITDNGVENFEFYKYNLLFYIAFVFIIRFVQNRILSYQGYANLLLLATIPQFVKEKHLRFLVASVLVAVVLFYWYHIVVVRLNSAVWPYRSIL